MCDPVTKAIIGSMVVGSGLQAKGASDQRKAGANAQNSNTRVSAQEFDSRDATARDVFAENMGLDRNAYDAIAAMDDEEFKTRTGLAKQQFDQLNDIDKQQIIRDATSAATNTGAIRDARVERMGTEDTARGEYDATLAAAQARQAGFRGQTDNVASDLTAAFGPDAMAQRFSGAAGARDRLVNRATTGTASAVPTSASADPAIRAIFAAESAKGRGKAADQAGRATRLAAYDDSIAEGDRVLNQGNERTAMISDAAARALAPLGAQLDTSSLKYNNASSRFRNKTDSAGADLDAALSLSDTRATGERRPVTDYTSAMDSAYGAFFGNKRGTVDSTRSGKIGANNNKLQGVNSVSQGLEQNITGINNFRANNAGTGLAGFTGQLLTSLGPALLGAQQRGTAANAFGKPKPIAVPSTVG